MYFNLQKIEEQLKAADLLTARYKWRLVFRYKFLTKKSYKGKGKK
jgi:hypothetical protein